jgi:hypothetical protein
MSSLKTVWRNCLPPMQRTLPPKPLCRFARKSLLLHLYQPLKRPPALRLPQLRRLQWQHLHLQWNLWQHPCVQSLYVPLHVLKLLRLQQRRQPACPR